MSVSLSVTQLRNLLQLPERPFEDAFDFDGTSYYDLTQREAVTLFGVSGTASGVPRQFINGTDFQLTAGCIDWTLPGAVKPDFGTLFVVDYTYSRLGGATASTCANNGSIIVTQDLGSSFPYGASTTAGIPFNNLAIYGASLIAASEACFSLATSDIDQAQKSRRGAVLVDDTKKSDNWSTEAANWSARYKKYLTMIRPGGMVRAFSIINRSYYSLLFGYPEAFAFDGVLDVAIAGFPDSGVF